LQTVVSPLLDGDIENKSLTRTFSIAIAGVRFAALLQEQHLYSSESDPVKIAPTQFHWA